MEEPGAVRITTPMSGCEQNLEESIKASGKSRAKVRDLAEVVAAAMEERVKG
jgi:Fe-S oxidoreductase